MNFSETTSMQINVLNSKELKRLDIIFALLESGAGIPIDQVRHSNRNDNEKKLNYNLLSVLFLTCSKYFTDLYACRATLEIALTQAYKLNRLGVRETKVIPNSKDTC